MSAIGIAMSAAANASKAQGEVANRMANANTKGFIGETEDFVHMATQGVGFGSYITAPRMIAEQVGSPEITASQGDLMVSGNGLMPVTGHGVGNGPTHYVKTGSFTRNKEGNLEAAATNSILMGWALKDDGTPENPSASGLTAIHIDQAMSVAGKATTEIDLSFQLRAAMLASGASQVRMMDPNNANSAAVRNSYIVVSEVFDPKSGKLTNEHAYQYGGFIIGTERLDTAGGIAANPITMQIGGNPPVTWNVPAGNNLTQLTSLAAFVNANGGTATLLSTVAGSHFIKIVCDQGLVPAAIAGNAASTATLAAFTNAANWVGGTSSIDAAPTGTRRFSDMTTLNTLLKADKFTTDMTGGILTLNNNSSMLRVDNMVTSGGAITSPATVAPWDVLSALGVSQGKRGSIMAMYDPTDEDYNMANGKISPDDASSVTVYDSKGGAKDLTVAFKKLTNRDWAVEVYGKEAALPGTLPGAAKIPLQASVLTFDGDGNYTGSRQALMSSVGTKTFDPTVSFPAATPVIQIGGQNYTYTAPPAVLAAGQFNNLANLVTAINNNAATPVTAELVKQGATFKIRITSKTAGGPVVVDANATTLLGLNSKPTYTPGNFGTPVTIDWLDGATLVNASNITLKLATDKIKERGGDVKYNFDATADGEQSGSFDRWEMDNGKIVATFTNGKTKPLYMVPVATTPNPNGFERSEDGTYEVVESIAGKLTLHQPGTSGAGTVRSKALLGSGADANKTLQEALELQAFSQYNSANFTIAKETEDTFLKRL